MRYTPTILSVLDVGRRPELKSNEFVGVSHPVIEVGSLLWLKPPNQMVQSLAAWPHTPQLPKLNTHTAILIRKYAKTLIHSVNRMWHVSIFSILNACIFGVGIYQNYEAFSSERWICSISSKYSKNIAKYSWCIYIHMNTALFNQNIVTI